MKHCDTCGRRAAYRISWAGCLACGGFDCESGYGVEHACSNHLPKQDGHGTFEIARLSQVDHEDEEDLEC